MAIEAFIGARNQMIFLSAIGILEIIMLGNAIFFQVGGLAGVGAWERTLQFAMGMLLMSQGPVPLPWALGTLDQTKYSSGNQK